MGSGGSLEEKRRGFKPAKATSIPLGGGGDRLKGHRPKKRRGKNRPEGGFLAERFNCYQSGPFEKRGVRRAIWKSLGPKGREGKSKPPLPKNFVMPKSLNRASVPGPFLQTRGGGTRRGGSSVQEKGGGQARRTGSVLWGENLYFQKGGKKVTRNEGWARFFSKKRTTLKGKGERRGVNMAGGFVTGDLMQPEIQKHT